jgi:hypothetical protein
MDVFEVLTQWSELAKTAATIVTFIGAAVPYVAVVAEHGKKGWTYVIGEKNRPVKLHDDVAIVVEITRPAVATVKRFLDQAKIDANIVVIRSAKLGEDQALQMLDDAKPAEWAEVVKTFRKQVEAIVNKGGVQRRFHVFISGPAALSFGLGSVVSTLYNMHVYNLVRGGDETYAAVLRLPGDVK